MLVSATDIVVYLGIGLVAVVIFVVLRLGAGKMGKADPDKVKASFATLPGFSPGETLVHQSSAISYDPVRNHVAIWEKLGGARLVDPSGVSAWRSADIVELYAKTGDKRPFFSVGVANAMDGPRWRDRLQAAFGADKERPSSVSA